MATLSPKPATLSLKKQFAGFGDIVASVDGTIGDIVADFGDNVAVFGDIVAGVDGALAGLALLLLLALLGHRHHHR